jgi:hypothetical protein
MVRTGGNTKMSTLQSESIRRTSQEGLKKEDFLAIGGKQFYSWTWARRDLELAKNPELAKKYAEVKAGKLTKPVEVPVVEAPVVEVPVPVVAVEVPVVKAPRVRKPRVKVDRKERKQSSRS